MSLLWPDGVIVLITSRHINKDAIWKIIFEDKLDRRLDSRIKNKLHP
jgi:hypothetical protein